MNAEILGFRSRQWEEAISISAFGQNVAAFWIYARRKGDNRRRLWVGIYDSSRNLAIIGSLPMSLEEWNNTTNIQRSEILKGMRQRYCEVFCKWEVIEYDFR